MKRLNLQVVRSSVEPGAYSLRSENGSADELKRKIRTEGFVPGEPVVLVSASELERFLADSEDAMERLERFAPIINACGSIS